MIDSRCGVSVGSCGAGVWCGVCACLVGVRCVWFCDCGSLCVILWWCVCVSVGVRVSSDGKQLIFHVK